MNRTRNNWWILPFIIISLLVILTGCNYRQGWVEMTYANRMRATYSLFDGQHGTAIGLIAADGTMTLTYDLEITKGNLSLQILNPGREVVWEDTFSESTKGSTSFTAEIDGRYRINVVGGETAGGFDLHWEIVQND